MEHLNLWLTLLGGRTLALGLAAGVMASRAYLPSQPIVAGVLAFRRPPMILAIRRFVPPLDRPAATVFVGWFGPIGVAAIYYALLAADRTGAEVVWVVASLVALGSILAHGMTAVPATLRYGRLEDEDESWGRNGGT